MRMRHLERFGSTTYSMVHYPREFMREVKAVVEPASGVPQPQNPLMLQGYLEENLTCVAMARYVLRCAGLALYGRGFGYTKILDPSRRTDHE